ncbi:MAG: SRPBCC family protein [Myxococcota bacterium]
MKVTIATYHRLARLIGGLLTLMGLGLTAVFVMFTWTGENPLVGSALTLDGPGLLIMASIGAFALPLGLSLLFTDAATSARLRIAACALGLMALLRLVAFANPEIRAAVGLAPIVEFFVLGGLGFVAFGLRPDNESPIEMRIEIEVDAPASEAWQVLGEQFGDVGQWASSLRSSQLDRSPGVGAVRTCELTGFGPFSAGRISEELLEFDPAAMRFIYAARTGLPRMFHAAKNRWSVEAVDDHHCRVRSHASIDLHWWALPLATWLGWGIRSGVDRFTEELRHRVERGTAHPRKAAALARA